MMEELKEKDIRIISFDGDGTLWDFEKVMIHSLEKVMEKLEQADKKAAEKLDVNKLIEIRNRIFDELKGEITNLEEVRLESFKESLREVGREDDELAKILNDTYLKHRFEDIELYEDVIHVLNHLSERYTIGLLSNGNSYPEKCGLDGIFDFVVFSQYVGVEKPDKRIFEHAYSKFDCDGCQIVHVGDSIENDVIGAENAGINGIWLNRDRRSCDEYEPRYEIGTLEELTEYL
ncbi:MAG: HAD family hydrolase [Thermoplasmatota archaeon]